MRASVLLSVTLLEDSESNTQTLLRLPPPGAVGAGFFSPHRVVSVYVGGKAVYLVMGYCQGIYHY